MGKKGKTVARVATIAVCVVTLAAALYIMLHSKGLSEELDFGAGAYYYADIPGFEKLDKSTYVTAVPRWLHIVLFLVWGALMYALWCWIDRKHKD